MQPIAIGVGGALGRMGRAVAGVIAERADLAVVAAFDRPGAADPAIPLGPIEAALARCAVIIDFSTAEATTGLAARAAAAQGPALVLGATGFTADQEAAIAAAAGRIAIVKSGNYSLGVNILAGVVEETARRLGPETWDIEVFEAHHRRKVDAPSGTALLLAAAAARGRGRDLAEIATPARDGVTGPRAEGTIGFSVLRGGGLVGEHSVVFAAEEEILTLSHSARDRRLFARGAVAAAAWVVGREPGLYDMRDVLGFAR